MSRTKTPRSIVLLILAISALPALLNLLGYDFGSSAPHVELEQLSKLSDEQLRYNMSGGLAESYVLVLLNWTAFVVALFTAVFSFVHFAVRKDLAAPIIGVALFTTAIMDALRTLYRANYFPLLTSPEQLLTLTNTTTDLFSGLILLIGFGSYVLWPHRKRRTRFISLVFVCVVLSILNYGVVVLSERAGTLPTILFPDEFIKRPIHLAPLTIFVTLTLFVLPRLHRLSPSPFTHSLLVSMIPQLLSQIYLTFGSGYIDDNAANVSKFLGAIAYVVPLAGLTLDYILSYRDEEIAKIQFKSAQSELLQRTSELQNTNITLQNTNAALAREIGERKTLEQALVQNEERIRTVLSNVPVIIFALDREGRFILSEGKGLAALGRRPGQVVGQSIFDVYPGHDVIHNNIKKALAGAAFTGVIEINDVIFETRYLPVRDKENNVVGVIGVSADISDRLKAEEALKNSEREYRDLVETSHDLIWSVDAEGRWTFVNSAVRRIYGYEPEEMLGRPFLHFLAPAVVAQDMETFARIKSGNPVFHYRTTHIRKDGSEIALSFNAIPQFDQDSQIIGTTGTASDITELCEAERELEDQRIFLRQVIDINPCFIFAKDDVGRFTLANEAVADAYGTTVEQLIGKTDADFNANADQVEHFRKDDREVISHLREKFIPEEIITDASGNIRWLQTYKRPILNSAGKGYQVLGVATDITFRKTAEEALRYRVEFEKLVTALSTGFISLDCEEIDSGVQKALEKIALFAKVERCFIFQLSESQDSVRMTHEWRSESLETIREQFLDLKVETYPWYIEKLRKLETVYVPRITDLPDVAAAERAILTSFSAKSFVGVPMVIGRALIGFVGFATMKHELEWQEDRIGLFRIVGDMFANAIQRKRTENALRQSEELYRKFFEEDLSGTYTTGADGRLLTCNAAFTRMFGFSSVEQALNTKVQELYPSPELRDAFVSMVRDNRSLDFYEVELRRLDGTPVHVVENAVGMFNDRGELVQIKGFLFDNTERKLAVEKLREQAALLDAAQDAICVLDLKGEVTYWNRGAERMYGWAAESVLRKTFEQLGIHDPSSVPSVSEMLVDGEWRGELEQHAKDGHAVFVDSTITVVHDNRNHPRALLSVSTDITEKKRMQGELLRASKLESVGILAGGIAHDFNNILTAIFGNLSLAKVYGKNNAEVLDKILKAERASQRAKDLTQQLLTFAKGGAPIRKTASIEEIIRESAELSLRGSNCLGNFAIPSNIWSVNVDVGQINQVLNNLLINAAQAMSSGGIIKISCDNHRCSENSKSEVALRPGNYVKITISDTGSGISPENLDKIFDPYFSTKPTGNGLGLATSYSIIKRHQGHIAVESQRDVGTTFYVYLPASSEPAVTKREEEFFPLLGKGRVLLMEDDEIVSDIACKMLEQLGYRVTCAAHGIEALHQFEEARAGGDMYDVIIMDLTIPGGMGGKEAIRRILEIDPRARVIVSSGYSNDPIMAHYTEYGFKGVIAKPYELKELGEVLHQVLADEEKGTPVAPAWIISNLN